jgi:hypothetical protein
VDWVAMLWVAAKAGTQDAWRKGFPWRQPDATPLGITQPAASIFTAMEGQPASSAIAQNLAFGSSRLPEQGVGSLFLTQRSSIAAEVTSTHYSFSDLYAQLAEACQLESRASLQ